MQEIKCPLQGVDLQQSFQHTQLAFSFIQHNIQYSHTHVHTHTHMYMYINSLSHKPTKWDNCSIPLLLSLINFNIKN